MKEYICEWCNKKYNCYPSQRRGKHQFCCMACRVEFTEANTKQISSACNTCGKPILLYRYDLDNHAHHFCNQKCQYDFFSGEGNPNFGRHLTQETVDKISATKKKNYKKENHPMYGKHHSKEAKAKMSVYHSNRPKDVRDRITMGHHYLLGEEHPNWKGGLSLLDFEEAYGIEMKEWYHLTKKVRERDSFTCQYCGMSPARIVHHIIPRHVHINNSMHNLITVCPKCHGYVEAKTSICIEQGIDPIAIFYDAWSK